MLSTLVATLLHAALLLIPTLLIDAAQITRPQIALFATMILVAATIEGILVCDAFDPAQSAILDLRAMQVARVVGILILIIYWIAQIEFSRSESHSHTVRYVGCIALVAGTLFRALAILSLGQQFTSDVRLVGQPRRTGIYARLDHPAELGMLLIAVGSPLILSAIWTAMAAITVLGPISVWRMKRENAIKPSAHGETKDDLSSGY